MLTRSLTHTLDNRLNTYKVHISFRLTARRRICSLAGIQHLHRFEASEPVRVSPERSFQGVCNASIWQLQNKPPATLGYWRLPFMDYKTHKSTIVSVNLGN